MELQRYLESMFRSWQPSALEVVDRDSNSISLNWSNLKPFQFLEKSLLFKLEMRNKIPPWIVVYSGGQTSKKVDNLPPSHPQKFRLKIIMKNAVIKDLRQKSLEFYENEENIYQKLGSLCKDFENIDEKYVNEEVDSKKIAQYDGITNAVHVQSWLESQWSEETWTGTDTAGTSIACFCMAVHCGYLKQMHTMLQERAELIDIVNTLNGLTPLATAVRKGDIHTTRFLLSVGADINQLSVNGKSPLHIAVLYGHLQIAELLLDRGADFVARDINSLRVEHFAVDSGVLNMVRLVFERGGDVNVRDNNGWTPLFRAICQGMNSQIIEELVIRGSSITAIDNAGLSILCAAKLLRNRQGRSRDSILRLVDPQFPHDKAIKNFTRLTQKVSKVHSLNK